MVQEQEINKMVASVMGAITDTISIHISLKQAKELTERVEAKAKEMMELVEIGYDNIICTQPFGCLPNHICGKGVMKKIKSLHPDANIVAIDYDPSATKVNQENRIKLMLAIAREKIKENEDAKL